MSTNAVTPTYCRPQHLDRERLRRLLARHDFDGVYFHEAVVATRGASSSSFQLLAVTSDALLLSPLGTGGSGACGSSNGLSAAVTRVNVHELTSVQRLAPAPPRLRCMLLHANSELFQISVASEPNHMQIFIATFEPSSRAFFYVTRAFRLAFQTHIMNGELPPPPALADDTNDLHDLLQDLLGELSTSGAFETRCRLLDELTTAATRDSVLQRLCFEDQSAIDSRVASGSITYGLLAFLLAELSLLQRTSSSTSGDVHARAYAQSLLQLLQCLFFGGLYVAARMRFFLQTPHETWLRVVTHVPCKAARADDWRIARDERMDLQVALLLDLELLQQEAALLDPTRVQRDAVMQTLLRHDAVSDEWIARVVKRVAVLVSRTAPQQLKEAERTRGSRWSLSLWRATKVVQRLLRLVSVQSDSRRPLADMLLRRRRDCIDLFLRNPHFRDALATSGVSHLVETAHDLKEIVERLS